MSSNIKMPFHLFEYYFQCAVKFNKVDLISWMMYHGYKPNINFILTSVADHKTLSYIHKIINLYPFIYVGSNSLLPVVNNDYNLLLWLINSGFEFPEFCRVYSHTEVCIKRILHKHTRLVPSNRNVVDMLG